MVPARSLSRRPFFFRGELCEGNGEQQHVDRFQIRFWSIKGSLTSGIRLPKWNGYNAHSFGAGGRNVLVHLEPKESFLSHSLLEPIKWCRFSFFWFYAWPEINGDYYYFPCQFWLFFSSGDILNAFSLAHN